MTDINPIRRELLKNALVTIADNALVMVTRTARTANVKNSMDFSSAICDGAGSLAARDASAASMTPRSSPRTSAWKMMSRARFRALLRALTRQLTRPR